jgi:hypothetical protein
MLGLGSGSSARTAALVAVLVSAAGLAACVTIVYSCVSSLLDLARTAAGANPPSAWIWLVPVSCVLGAAFAIANAAAAGLAGGFNLLLALWSGLFLALAGAFLESAGHPQGAEPTAPWMVLAVTFFVMGVGPVPLVLSGKAKGTYLHPIGTLDTYPRRVYLALNLVAIASGIAIGLLTFNALSG